MNKGAARTLTSMTVEPQGSYGGGRLRDAGATGVLVLLLHAGYIKASPLLAWVPADLTLLSGAAVLVACTLAVLRPGFQTPQGLGPVLMLFVCFIPAVIWSSDNPYATEKVGRLFTLTLLCAVATTLLVRTPRRVWWFVGWSLVAGFGMAILARLAPSVEIVGTLALEGSNTIALGRATGAGLVAVGALVMTRRLPWPMGLPVALVLVVAMFSTGSRGPLVAAAVAAVIAVAVVGHSTPPFLRIVLVLSGLVAVTTWALASTNESALHRIQLLFAPDRGSSVDTRVRLFVESVATTWRRWEGLGWGDLTERVPTYADVGFRLYSHNAILEAFAEGGLIAGVALTATLVTGWRRLRAVAIDPTGATLLALFVYWTINGMVSGDLNDNRSMFALIAAALASPQVLGIRSHYASVPALPGLEGASKAIGLTVDEAPASEVPVAARSTAVTLTLNFRR